MDTKELNKEFERVVNILFKTGDEQILLDIIPFKLKKEFVDTWEELLEESQQ